MRRIMMKALAAGPEGVLRPGTAVDVPEAQAAELIAGGYAEDLAQPSGEPEAATEQAEETAAASQGEAATAGPAEARG